MAFDPAADPWGTAMLASAAVVALAVFVLVAAILTATPKRAGTRLLGLGCFLFLGTALGGTWVRIADADASKAKAEVKRPDPVTIVAPEVPPDPDGPAGAGESGDSGGGSDDEAGAEAGDGAAGDGATPTAITNPDPTPEPEPEPAAVQSDLAPSESPKFDTSPASIPAPEPLPADADARDKAISALVYETRQIADDPKRCADIETVAAAWKAVKALPEDAKARDTAAKRLDGCRKKIRGAKTYAVRRQRIDARNAYAAELPGKLKVDDSYVFVNVRGKSHERMRIGGRSITKARIDALLAAGFDDQLEALGVSEVTFASSDGSRVEKLEVEEDSEIVDAIMGAWGLGDKLAFE